MQPNWLNNYFLKSEYLLGKLSLEIRQLLKQNLIRKEFEKGELLYKERSIPKGLYILRKGKVKIFKRSLNAKQSLIYIYKKGDFFGHRPILAEEYHPVSAMAMNDIVLEFLPKDAFIKLVKSHPDFAYELLRIQSKEFNVWTHKLTLITQYNVKERLAIILLFLNEVYKRESDEISVIILSRDELANFVGTAKETLVRMLRVFKDLDIISTQGTRIIIQDEEQLQNMVEKIKA